MSKIILGIHGLGNKPPYELLQRWWKQSICEGLSAIGYPRRFLKFQVVYWANFIHPQPLNPAETDKENPLYLEDPYIPAKDFSQKFTKRIRKKVLDYLEKQLDKLLLNEDLSINFSVITDFIIHHFFNDLEVYYTKKREGDIQNGSSVNTSIRDQLLQTLKQYKKKDIMLIAHSMGSIIAYDVLIQNESDIEIDTLVTLGSPLGIPIIMKKIMTEQKMELDEDRKLRTPDNIRNKWYNFSDLNDKIALNYDLGDDYGTNISRVQPIDQIVYNNYEIRGERNPHKAYGYLRTPQVSRVIHNFLNQDRNKIMIWFSEKINRLLYQKRFFTKN
jgi:hypothetical protein